MHYNGANSYLFVNGTEIYKFKANDSEIVVGPICLGNISKGWSVDNIKRTGFTSYVYDFSVDYDPVAVDDIKDIHKYLMKKKWCSMYKMFVFINKVFYIGSIFLSSLVGATPLSCISMNYQAYKVRPGIVNVNSNEPAFYPFSIKTSKCSGSCNVFLML